MSYLIACWKSGLPYAISASTDCFTLVPLDSDSAVCKVFSHPYRSGAQKILNWIKENDDELNGEDFSIQDCARFQK